MGIKSEIYLIFSSLVVILFISCSMFLNSFIFFRILRVICCFIYTTTIINRNNNTPFINLLRHASLSQIDLSCGIVVFINAIDLHHAK